MAAPNLIFAYFGPETVLPVTSIVATVIGVVMMMGKNSIYWIYSSVKGAVRFCLRMGPETTAPHAPPARSTTTETAETR